MKKMSFPDKGIARNLAICALIGSFSVIGRAEIIINQNSPLTLPDVSEKEEWVPISGEQKENNEWVPIAKPVAAGEVESAVDSGEENQTVDIPSLETAYREYKRSDYDKAYKGFSYYAQNNDWHAVMATAYLLFTGYGVVQDYAKASAYLDRAEKAGFARAYYLHGLLERNKTNTSQFNLVAERFLNKAANMGDALAANALANQYFHRGNTQEALRWNQKAIELGSRAAKKNQHVISSGGNNKIITASAAGSNDALAQLRKSSAEGNAQATYELATRYHKGVGVNVNYNEAIRLYRVAAGQGSDAARKILPVLLSRQSSTSGINSMWMQETSNMIAMPPVILTDKENRGGNKGVNTYSPIASHQQVSLAEDDPLENLLNLMPARISAN